MTSPYELNTVKYYDPQTGGSWSTVPGTAFHDTTTTVNVPSPTSSPVSFFRKHRHGSQIAFSWHVAAPRTVLGFRLFAGHKALNRGIITSSQQPQL